MGSKNHFTTVKTFSGTLPKDRDGLGDQVGKFLTAHPELMVIDKAVTQSSDKEFHCLTITLFLAPREQKEKKRPEHDDE